MGNTLQIRRTVLHHVTTSQKGIAVTRESVSSTNPDAGAQIHVHKERALLSREFRFLANGGTIYGADTVRAFLGKTFVFSGVTFPAATGTASQPYFGGWFTAADGGVKKTESDSFQGFDRLYAHYHDKLFTVDLRSQWYLQGSSSTDPNGKSSPLQKNPDPSQFDGVYTSYGHWNQHNTIDVMRITLIGYTTFRLYIRSYAESSYDYVTVGRLDQAITYDPGINGKATTRNKQQSGQELSNYIEVVFTSEDGLTVGTHFIDICYRKDYSSNAGNDRGYVLIPKNQ